MRTMNHRDSPMYWFALLEMAREHGEFLQAQHALEQLRRLGVEVRFSPRKPSPPKGGPHAA